MRTVLFGVALVLAAAGAAEARGGGGSHYVSGYTRSNGTYVAPHYSANPGSGSSSSGFLTVPSTSDHSVSGYTNRSGTYVQPYRQTDQNSTRLDNYSTKGNVNPYTGKPGTKSPYGF